VPPPFTASLKGAARPLLKLAEPPVEKQLRLTSTSGVSSTINVSMDQQRT